MAPMPLVALGESSDVADDIPDFLWFQLRTPCWNDGGLAHGGPPLLDSLEKVLITVVSSVLCEIDWLRIQEASDGTITFARSSMA